MFLEEPYIFATVFHISAVVVLNQQGIISLEVRRVGAEQRQTWGSITTFQESRLGT